MDCTQGIWLIRKRRLIMRESLKAMGRIFIVLLIVTTNIVAFGFAVHNAKVESNRKYTSSDGREWDYCVELSNKDETGIMYYMVFTNKKDLTYEEWEEAYRRKDDGFEDYEDFYLVKERLRRYEDFWY